MKCKLTRDMPCSKKVKKDYPSGIIPAGTILDSHRAHIMVGMGFALPVDDECVEACGMSQEQIEQAQEAFPCLEAGIEREDVKAFKFGAMTGYHPETGKWIEGPKYDEWMSSHNEENEEEDDE